MTLVSKGAIFHFHDYGRKGILSKRVVFRFHVGFQGGYLEFAYSTIISDDFSAVAQNCSE